MSRDENNAKRWSEPCNETNRQQKREKTTPLSYTTASGCTSLLRLQNKRKWKTSKWTLLNLLNAEQLRIHFVVIKRTQQIKLYSNLHTTRTASTLYICCSGGITTTSGHMYTFVGCWLACYAVAQVWQSFLTNSFICTNSCALMTGFQHYQLFIPAFIKQPSSHCGCRRIIWKKPPKPAFLQILDTLVDNVFTQLQHTTVFWCTLWADANRKHVEAD